MEAFPTTSTAGQDQVAYFLLRYLSLFLYYIGDLIIVIKYYQVLPSVPLCSSPISLVVIRCIHIITVALLPFSFFKIKGVYSANFGAWSMFVLRRVGAPAVLQGARQGPWM